MTVVEADVDERLLLMSVVAVGTGGPAGCCSPKMLS